MANTQAMATSFKQELLNGHHAFGTSVTRGGTGADTFKAALYLATATLNASTTATVWLSSGTAGVKYLVTCRMTSSAGRIIDDSFQVRVLQR